MQSIFQLASTDRMVKQILVGMFEMRHPGSGDGSGHSRRSSRAYRWTEEETECRERRDEAPKRISASVTRDSLTGSVAS